MKNVAVAISVPKSIYEWPFIPPKIFIFYELLESSVGMFDVTNRRYNKQIYMSFTIYLTI